jgi:RHS repeat-associated protein
MANIISTKRPTVTIETENVSCRRTCGNRAWRSRPRWRRATSGRRHYNYFRDYDSRTGRYLQSDPIGLAGGLSTYGYVGGNPLTRIDPQGLACKSVGGKTYCAHPGGPLFMVPTPKGWKDFDGSEVLHHDYHVRRKLGCADGQAVMQVT